MAGAVRVLTPRQLDRLLGSLPELYRKKLTRKAFRAAGAVLVREIRSQIKSSVSRKSASRDRARRRVVTRTIKKGKRAGETTSKKTSLASSITQRVRMGKRGIYGVVGAAYAEAPHAHLVERGHRIVLHDGTDTGKRAKPNPFQRRAERAAKKQVLVAMAAKMKAEVAKINNQLRSEAYLARTK